MVPRDNFNLIFEESCLSYLQRNWAVYDAWEASYYSKWLHSWLQRRGVSQYRRCLGIYIVPCVDGEPRDLQKRHGMYRITNDQSDRFLCAWNPEVRSEGSTVCDNAIGELVHSLTDEQRVSSDERITFSTERK